MTKLLAAAALIASQIGAPLPVATPVIAPTADGREISGTISAPARGWDSGSVSAAGYLSGSGFLFCNEPSNGSGTGWMSGSINLTAGMRASGPDGASGTIPVWGHVFLRGTCRRGAGFVSGSASVNGYGPLYDRDGKRAGTASLSGLVFVNQYASSQHVWINEYASLTGRFDPAN